MFNFLKRKKKPTPPNVVPIIPVVACVRPITVPTIQKPKTKALEIQKPIGKYRKFIRVNGFMNDVYDSVLLGMLPDTNIVLVFRKNNNRVTPFLKWVNVSYCADMKRNAFSVTHINPKIMNIDNWDVIKCTRL